MAYEVPVALISGGLGFATGVVGTLFGPWNAWAAEKRRRKHDRRVKRVEEWRKGVNSLRVAEAKYGTEKPVVKTVKQEGKVSFQWDTEVPDSDLVNVYTKPWFRTLRRELPTKALARIEVLTGKPPAERIGELPALLDDEINNIESDKWDLV